jgi:hypothetical protein
MAIDDSRVCVCGHAWRQHRWTGHCILCSCSSFSEYRVASLEGLAMAVEQIAAPTVSLSDGRTVRLGRIRPKAPPVALQFAAYYDPEFDAQPPPQGGLDRQGDGFHQAGLRQRPIG